jgi:hypothetical protein
MKKTELKDMMKKEAKELREMKIELKEAQRAGRPSNMYGVQLAQWDYRHKHIAYCLLKGRQLNEIEQKNREGNEPNLDLVDKYKRQFIGDNNA